MALFFPRCIHSYGRFLNWGYPHHPFHARIFHEINPPAMLNSPRLWNPHIPKAPAIGGSQVGSTGTNRLWLLAGLDECTDRLFDLDRWGDDRSLTHGEYDLYNRYMQICIYIYINIYTCIYIYVMYMCIYICVCYVNVHVYLYVYVYVYVYAYVCICIYAYMSYYQIYWIISKK